MGIRVLALGRKSVTRRVAQALAGQDLVLSLINNISEAVIALKKEKFDLTLIDGYMEELEHICTRITWQCRLPVILIINGQDTDWNLLRRLDVDGFIPDESSGSEAVAYFKSVIRSKNPRPEPARILIIEDDLQTLESLRLGFNIYWPEAEVHCAASGQEGLFSYRINPADIVLLDLKLPDISGFEVLAKIRSVSQVPVLVITATRTTETVVKAMEAGASDYILKPFRQLSLLSRIRQHLTMGAAVSKIPE
ncbi:MAG TPA: response regulator [Dehalococcoidales bacterium]|nr:response regulator [Dehalococcoidales bacterium]